MRRVSGEWIYVRNMCRVSMLTQDGRAGRVLGVIRDVSEQVTARELEQHMKRVFTAMQTINQFITGEKGLFSSLRTLLMFMNRGGAMPDVKAKSRKVMIVDDMLIVSMELQVKLKDAGYAIAGTAVSGEEAVSLFRETDPDLILMDIMLKGEMNGIEAAAIIHEMSDVPVIYTTAYSDEKTLNELRATGPYAYLLKPYDDRELFTAVELALDRHQHRREIQASENKYRSLFENMTDAVILLKVQRDVNEAVSDALIIEANQSFEKITGVANTAVIDKCILDLYPYIKEFKPDWKIIFRQVIEDRKPLKLRVDLKRLGKWVKLTAYSPEPDHVASH